MKKFYTCRYDRAFKEVFMKESNKDILSKLLESILDLKIKEIKFLNLERNVDNLNVKRKHLDLYLDTNIGKIEVEVNSEDNDYVRPRNTSYLCDIYSHHTLIGKEYNELTLIIQINFSYGLNYNEYIRKYMIQDEVNNKFVNNFIIYEINMEKYMEIWYNKNEKEIDRNKYLLMLNLELKDLENLSNDKVVSKYMNELEQVNENPEFREYMSVEEDNLKIENSLKREWMEAGEQKGLEKGIMETKIATVKAMLNKQIDVNIISDITGLTDDEILKLK